MGLIQLLSSMTLQLLAAAQNSNNSFLKSYPDSISSQLRSYAIFPVGHTESCLKSTAPAQTLFMQGQLISRTTYADLWNYANTSGNIVSEAVWSAGQKGSFSVGDGSTTFRIPDFRGCTLTGYDATQAEFNTLGKTGGVKSHTLTAAEIQHTHLMSGTFAAAGTTGNGWVYTGSGTIAASSPRTNNVDSVTASAMSLLSPFAAVNYIIVY
jgi:microcystin-dependent protein